MTITIDFPHPARALRPNGRAHRMAVAAARKQARRDAYVLAMAAQVRECRECPGYKFRPRSYELTWYYWRARPDKDNCLASVKAYLDGCADAFKVNDREWDCAGIHTTKDKAKDKSLEITFNDENP